MQKPYGQNFRGQAYGLTEPSYRALIRVGPSVTLLSVADLSLSFGLPVTTVESLMGLLKVPVIVLDHPDGEGYVNLPALEAALFEATALPHWKDAENLEMHQTLAGLLYGSLDKACLQERVYSLIKPLTKRAKSGKLRGTS